MTNEVIHKLIIDLNCNNLKFKFSKHSISQNVDFAKIWIDDFEETKNEYQDYAPYIFFLIKDNYEKYVGAVLDMKNDLHWYILPEDRGNGYLTKNLANAILPFISQSRMEQRITINLWNIGKESFNRSQKVAITVGFIKVESDNYGKFEYIADLRDMNSKFV